MPKWCRRCLVSCRTPSQARWNKLTRCRSEDIWIDVSIECYSAISAGSGSYVRIGSSKSYKCLIGLSRANVMTTSHCSILLVLCNCDLLTWFIFDWINLSLLGYMECMNRRNYLKCGIMYRSMVTEKFTPPSYGIIISLCRTLLKEAPMALWKLHYTTTRPSIRNNWGPKTSGRATVTLLLAPIGDVTSST